MDANSALTTQTDFDQAVGTAVEAAQAYYQGTTQAMADGEYDRLVDQISAAKAEHPDWDDRGVTTDVAAGTAVTGAAKVTHPTRMLSLDKSTTQDEVRAFLDRLPTGTAVAVEPKLDGLAIRAVYQDSRLVQASLRGDGTVGDDITEQALRGEISGLPLYLPTNAPVDAEVRGEVFMTDTDFENANAARTAAGKTAYVNPRNATAGALRQLDRDYDVPMSFAAYDITSTHQTFQTSTDAATWAADHLTVGTARHLVDDLNTTATSPDEVMALIDRLETHRPTLGFPIDGAVIKVDDQTTRDNLGEGSRTPYWALAYKYAAEEATSTLLAVEVRVGRTGRISLRGVIEPVFVGGTTVSYATLHNPAWAEQQGFAVGQTVNVKRAGDVIPRITAPVGERPEGVEAWTAPETCPQCGEAWDKSSLLWRCHTPTCSVVGRIEYWGARDSLDVEGLSTATAEALVESGLVNNVADLYDLTVDQIAALRMGETSTGGDRLLGAANAAKIMQGLADSKTQPLNRVVTGLGIRGTGRSVGRWLASSLKSIDALRAATVDDLCQIDKIGPEKAQMIVDGVAQMSDVIDRLVEAGLTTEVEQAAGPQPLAGKTYVVSGAVPGYTRTTIAEAIEARGGKASSSVSKTTTALVTAETGTSKAKKAESLGIPVIDPADFVEMLS